jgi:hypothetical protein
MFARAADFLFLRLFAFAAAYLVFIYTLRIIWLSIFLSTMLVASLTIALHIWKGLRLDKFVALELSKLKKECLLEKIVMMDAAGYRSLTKKILHNLGYGDVKGTQAGYIGKKDGETVFAKAFFLHPSEKVGANEILNAYKQALKLHIEHITLLTPSEFNKEAEIFAKRQEHVTLIQSEEFLGLAIDAGFAVNDEEANAAAADAIRKNAVTPEDIREAALKKGKAKAYMLCGIFALAWSYISGFHFYYPIIAVACFVLAYFIHRREQSEAHKKA